MKYSDIQQRRRRAEKLINRAMNHAKEGNLGPCAVLMAQAGNELQLISRGVNGHKEISDAQTFTFPPLNDDLINILSRANFQCHHLAICLRADGIDIPKKSEREQAAVIHWLLGLYFKHGTAWYQAAGKELDRIRSEIEAGNGVTGGKV